MFGDWRFRALVGQAERALSAPSFLEFIFALRVIHSATPDIERPTISNSISEEEGGQHLCYICPILTMVKLFGWGQADISQGHTPLSQVTKSDISNDCLVCRLTGSSLVSTASRCSFDKTLGAAAFVGLGAYSFWSGMYHINTKQKQILKSGSPFGIASRKAGIAGIAATLCGMGMYRLVN